MAHPDEEAYVLGLTTLGKDANGTTVEAGDRVQLVGKVIRIHGSGFMAIELVGKEPQPAVMVKCVNTEKAYL